MKALIVFATRKGWTLKSADVIAAELEKLGFDVFSCGGKIPKLIEDDIGNCDLVVVGSGLDAGSWRSGPKKFLKTHGKQIRNLSVFVTEPGTLYWIEKEGMGHAWAVETAINRFIMPTLKRLNLQPRHVIAFGGDITWIKHHKENNWVRSDIVAWADGLARDFGLRDSQSAATSRCYEPIDSEAIAANSFTGKPDFDRVAATIGWPH